MSHLFYNHWRCASKVAERDVTVVSRVEWGALPQVMEDPPLKLPAKVILYPHTRTRQCHSRQFCINLVRDIQKSHMIAGYSDILYNFLIGGDGVVYEGRGFKTYGIKFNHKRKEYYRKLDIAFIGDFAKSPGQKANSFMKKTAELFVKWCKSQKLVSEKCLEIPVAYDDNKLSMWYPFLDAEFPHCDTINPLKKR